MEDWERKAMSDMYKTAIQDAVGWPDKRSTKNEYFWGVPDYDRAKVARRVGNAQKMGEELMVLRTKLGGYITPKDIINLARHPKSSCHNSFDWDGKGTAANKYRLSQAEFIVDKLCLSHSTAERSMPGEAIFRDDDRTLCSACGVFVLDSSSCKEPCASNNDLLYKMFSPGEVVCARCWKILSRAVKAIGDTEAARAAARAVRIADKRRIADGG